MNPEDRGQVNICVATSRLSATMILGRLYQTRFEILG
jgi:hypothetical protein